MTIEDGVTPKSERYDRSNLVSNKAEKLYKVVHPSDIVYNPSNLRWGAVGISKENKAILVSPIYEVLYVRESQHEVRFLFYLLSSPRQIQIFSTYGEGTLIERIAVKVNAFLSVPIFLPILSEQTRIAAVLLTCDREIELLRRKEIALREQKKGLMQKLLTGEVRVKM